MGSKRVAIEAGSFAAEIFYFRFLFSFKFTVHKIIITVQKLISNHDFTAMNFPLNVSPRNFQKHALDFTNKFHFARLRFICKIRSTLLKRFGRKRK